MILFTNKTAEMSIILCTSSRSLALKVFPVSTMSTIASAIPTFAASSTAPFNFKIFTFIPFFSKKSLELSQDIL